MYLWQDGSPTDLNGTFSRFRNKYVKYDSNVLGIQTALKIIPYPIGLWNRKEADLVSKRIT